MRRLVGTGMAFFPDRYGPVTRLAASSDRFGGSLGNDLSAKTPGGGTEVEQFVGPFHHLAVVLDDKEGIAQVAEAFQGGQQAFVVSGVQPDGGFVKDVENTAQAAAHLGRQTDSLHFAARQGRSGPAQREVVEPHVDEESNAVLDFPNQFAGHLLLGRVGGPLLDPGLEFAQGHAA